MKILNVIVSALFIFILINKASSQSFGWAGHFGGIGEDVVREVHAANGNFYATGYFTDNADMDPGNAELELISNGFFDVFIVKTNSSGDLQWARGFGAQGADYGTGIATDLADNVYITGVFEDSMDADPGAGISMLTSNGAQDIFIVKLNSTGDFVWAANIGGVGYDESTAIVSDASGNIYVAGYFNETADFDPGTGTALFTGLGLNDNFVVKLNSSGDYVWAAQFGSAGFEAALDIELSASNTLCITGFFEGTVDFDPGSGTSVLSSGPVTAGFISLLNTSGNFLDAGILAGTGNVTAYEIETDAIGNILVTGTFSQTTDFDPGPGIASLTSINFDNGFILKLNQTLDFIWVKSLSSAESLISYSVSTDAAGNVYSSGYYENTADFDPGSAVFELTPAAGNAMGAFLCKLNSNGDFVNAWSFGGVNFADYHGAVADAAGNVYISGAFENTVDVNPDPLLSQNISSLDFRDNYIIKMSVEPIGIDSPGYYRTWVYPNPAHGSVSFKTPQMNADYILFNLAGKSIQSGKINGLETTLNLNGIAPAIYLLKVGNTMSKIVVY